MYVRFAILLEDRRLPSPPQFLLVLIPHLLCNQIASGLCLVPFCCRDMAGSKASSARLRIQLQVPGLAQIVLKLIWIIATDIIMDSSKCCRYASLLIQIHLERNGEDPKTTFQDSKDSLDNIPSHCVTQIEQLLMVSWAD